MASIASSKKARRRMRREAAGLDIREERGDHGQLRQSELHRRRIGPQGAESHFETLGAEQELKRA